jgi:DNA primase
VAKPNINIVDVVSKYTELRPAGFYMKGKCPLTENCNDFTAHPGLNRFFCFGCFESGGVIKFLMRKEKLTRKQAWDFVKKMKK